MDLKSICISPTTSILRAIENIDVNGVQIVLVVDDKNRLLGTVTDGDVRRAILKGIPLDEPVTRIMNTEPTVGSVHDNKAMLLRKMERKRLHQIPVVAEDGYLVGLEVLDEIIKFQHRENWVVLMAGGLGSRLRPLTNNCPKPLLKVGSKPILETIIENFIEFDFRKFFISVNYKAEMIEEYFGNGSQWGVEIEYIREENKMGTAGALTLLREKPNKPLIDMNGDLLTKINFSQLLNYHIENQAQGTMCVRELSFQVPYGVVKIDKHRLLGIDEKPIQRFLINAGIYVLEPHLLDLIPPNTHYNMTSLFEEAINRGLETATFPIREYWLDIGQMSDYEKANGEYNNFFNDGIGAK
ncbi:MAG: nucleotidyltransferase family protein [Bacillota bacterium]